MMELSNPVALTLQARAKARWGGAVPERKYVTRRQIAGLLDSQVTALGAHEINQLTAREIGRFNSWQIRLLIDRNIFRRDIEKTIVQEFLAQLKNGLQRIFAPEDNNLSGVSVSAQQYKLALDKVVKATGYQDLAAPKA